MADAAAYPVMIKAITTQAAEALFAGEDFVKTAFHAIPRNVTEVTGPDGKKMTIKEFKYLGM